MSGMITGRLITAGRIATCENYSETTYGENLDIDVVNGILIVMDDNNVRAAASSMLGKEIEVRLPAPSDRASIVAYIKHIAVNGEFSATSESLLHILAAQIKRGDDVSATAAPA